MLTFGVLTLKLITMKKLLFFILFLPGCTYKTYITVLPRMDVPSGSKEFVVYAPMDSLLNRLKAHSILYNFNESGVQTEEFLIDEGTRARINLYPMEDAVKVVPFWGITDRVRSDMAIAVGYATASTYSNELKRVTYRKSEARPKMAFDYSVQVFDKTGKIIYR